MLGLTLTQDPVVSTLQRVRRSQHLLPSLCSVTSPAPAWVFLPRPWLPPLLTDPSSSPRSLLADTSFRKPSLKTFLPPSPGYSFPAILATQLSLCKPLLWSPGFLSGAGSTLRFCDSGVWSIEKELREAAEVEAVTVVR